jgi:hypothetical protein
MTRKHAVDKISNLFAVFPTMIVYKYAVSKTPSINVNTLKLKKLLFETFWIN